MFFKNLAAWREVASAGGRRKAQRTTGRPIHVPWGPVNTFWVAGR
jgi:hypothetical protein